MSSVEFQEEDLGYNPNLKKKKSASRMVAWLVDKGYAKDEFQANSTLIITTVVFLILAIIAIVL